MTISRRKLIVTLGLGSAASLLPRAAFAAYPDRPIRLIVPFAAGGNADIVGRLVADQISRALGVPAIVDNRGGAGGSIGAEAVARATPDGYTDRKSTRLNSSQLGISYAVFCFNNVLPTPRLAVLDVFSAPAHCLGPPPPGP